MQKNTTKETSVSRECCEKCHGEFTPKWGDNAYRCLDGTCKCHSVPPPAGSEWRENIFYDYDGTAHCTRAFIEQLVTQAEQRGYKRGIKDEERIFNFAKNLGRIDGSQQMLERAIAAVPTELQEGAEIYAGSDNKNMPVAERVGYNSCRAETLQALSQLSIEEDNKKDNE
jgi:hypothetical protein